LGYASLLEELSELNLDIGALVQGATKEENKPYHPCCLYANELNDLQQIGLAKILERITDPFTGS
jgi:hypothetical protein